MIERARTRMAQAFADRPEGVAICFGLVAGACLFLFNGMYALPVAERESVALVATSYYLSAAACLGLAIWVWRRNTDTTNTVEIVVLIALSLFAFNIIWTEHRWPDLSYGPTGYMAILTCVSGSLLRRGSVLAAFLLVTNTAWLIAISQGNGVGENIRIQHTFVVISVVAALISFAVLKGERVRQAGLTDRLVNQVRFDLLTGVLTRRGLSETLTERAAPLHPPVWCAYVDIDGFKAMNDEFGHAHGDLVLAAVGDALAQATDPDCPVARWGGDEFVVVGESEVPDEDRLEAELNRLLSSGSATCRVSLGLVTVGLEADPGAVDPAPGRCAAAIEDLIREADHRMYRRRHERRGRTSSGGPATTARR